MALCRSRPRIKSGAKVLCCPVIPAQAGIQPRLLRVGIRMTLTHSPPPAQTGGLAGHARPSTSRFASRGPGSSPGQRFCVTPSFPRRRESSLASCASFTLRQAFLSATLSVILAIPLARALARRRFRGREALTTLLGAPFLLPVIVAILGVIAVWGRSGWISDAMQAMGLGRLDVYGMPGVLIAHVFFNLPLAARLILQGFSDLPPERWRVAAQLGVEGGALFRLVEWPAIRASAPGAFALVFLVCATSFAVALALGGGPRATTLELAIYEAASYDFDLGRAAKLAGLQVGVCAVAALVAHAAAAPVAASPGALTLVQRWDRGFLAM